MQTDPPVLTAPSAATDRRGEEHEHAIAACECQKESTKAPGNRSVLVDSLGLALGPKKIKIEPMARPKEEDRPRSIRIPLTETMFQIAHKLAADVPIATYFRRLIEREAIAAKLIKPRTKGKAR